MQERGETRIHACSIEEESACEHSGHQRVGVHVGAVLGIAAVGMAPVIASFYQDFGLSAASNVTEEPCPLIRGFSDPEGEPKP
jgi:pyruvate/2-oxoglutarate/acetoin dehydrogenase E1 component